LKLELKQVEELEIGFRFSHNLTKTKYLNEKIGVSHSSLFYIVL